MELIRLVTFGGDIPLNYRLAFGLTAKEFACKHGWIGTDDTFLDRYNTIRTEIRIPLIITSGFRCQQCQDELYKNIESPVTTGMHPKGRAIDCYPIIKKVSAKDEQLLFLRDELLDYRDKIRIAIYPTHIHFDDAIRDKPELSREWWVIKGKYYYIKDVFR